MTYRFPRLVLPWFIRRWFDRGFTMKLGPNDAAFWTTLLLMQEVIAARKYGWSYVWNATNENWIRPVSWRALGWRP